MTIDTIDPGTSLATLDQGAMASWSDEKRDDFISLYKARTNVARYLLHRTAAYFMAKCLDHRFISQRHTKPIHAKYNFIEPWQVDPDNYRHRRGDTDFIDLGGRSREELEVIAKERAAALYKELPPLKKAVEVIDAPTAQLIGDVEKLKKKAQAAADALEASPSEISLSDHLDMTCRDFLAEVKKLAAKRKRWVRAIRECGAEARAMEVRIAKKLYSGLPGLSEAVVAVIVQHMDKATGLDQLNRRIGEQVKFGDSEAAMNLLKGFELDEAKVSDEMADQIKGAMDVLKTKVKALAKAKRAKAKALKAKKGAK